MNLNELTEKLGIAEKELSIILVLKYIFTCLLYGFTFGDSRAFSKLFCKKLLVVPNVAVGAFFRKKLFYLSSTLPQGFFCIIFSLTSALHLDTRGCLKFRQHRGVVYSLLFVCKPPPAIVRLSA